MVRPMMRGTLFERCANAWLRAPRARSNTGGGSLVVFAALAVLIVLLVLNLL